MKTSLNSKPAVARIALPSKDVPVKDSTIKLSNSVKESGESQKKDDLIERVQLAIENKNEEQLKWLQLELQVRSTLLLEKIDWKLWEIYAKYVR
jgi:hypothetical protein